MQRFAEGRDDAFVRAARIIHQRTEGNPLFMINVIDYLVECGSLFNAGTVEAPRTIQQMIEHNLERLTREEQSVLEAASVAGAEFSAAAIAAALEQPISEVETCCVRLARQQQFIDSSGASEWPDGTIASRFHFHHALYGDVLYERLPAGHGVQLHRRIAEREETAYGPRASEIAAELGNHYQRAGSKDRAIEYLGLAGRQAIERSAHADAIGSLSMAIALLLTYPESADRMKKELSLQIALGHAFLPSKGWAVPEVEQCFSRVRQICERLGDVPELFPALYGLWSVNHVRGLYRVARDYATELLRPTWNANDPMCLEMAHNALEQALLHTGEFPLAMTHLKQVLALYDNDRDRPLVYSTGADAKVVCLNYMAWALWLLGYPDQAVQNVAESIAIARSINHPNSLAISNFVLNLVRSFRREAALVQEGAENLIAFSAEHGLGLWLL